MDVGVKFALLGFVGWALSQQGRLRAGIPILERNGLTALAAGVPRRPDRYSINAQIALRRHIVHEPLGIIYVDVTELYPVAVQERPRRRPAPCACFRRRRHDCVRATEEARQPW
jgi:hypothetical protein